MVENGRTALSTMFKYFTEEMQEISSNPIFSSETCYSKRFSHFMAFPFLAKLYFLWLCFYLSAIIGRKLCMLCAVFFHFFSSKRKKDQQLQFPLSCSSSIQDSCSARQQNELRNIYSLHSVKTAILQQIVSVSMPCTQLALPSCTGTFTVIMFYFYTFYCLVQFSWGIKY